MITPHERRIIEDIIGVFETGHPRTLASYSAAVVLTDGAGITYGARQFTARSGALTKVIGAYVRRGGLLSGSLLAALRRLPETYARQGGRLVMDPAHPPPWVEQILSDLRDAGAEPAMREAQDEVGERDYWAPGAAACEAMGLVRPLSWLAYQDAVNQSGPDGARRLRRLFPERPPADGGDEQAWARAYVLARQLHLLASGDELVRASVYRTKALIDLIEGGAWDLLPPLRVRGQTIR